MPCLVRMKTKASHRDVHAGEKIITKSETAVSIIAGVYVEEIEMYVYFKMSRVVFKTLRSEAIWWLAG